MSNSQAIKLNTIIVVTRSANLPQTILHLSRTSASHILRRNRSEGKRMKLMNGLDEHVGWLLLPHPGKIIEVYTK